MSCSTDVLITTDAIDRCIQNRVLFVDQTSALGGAELSLLDILRLRGFQDPVALFQHGRFEELLRQCGADVYVCELSSAVASVSKAAGALASVRTASSLLKQILAVRKIGASCDVLYANTPKAFVVCALAGSSLRMPVIYHLRDILSAEHFSRSNLWVLVTLANRCASHLIANSQATAEAFVQAGGKREKVTVIYNGFDVAALDARSDRQCDHRMHLLRSLELVNASGESIDASGCKMADVSLVAVFGRLAPWKGQHVAITALADLPNAHLLLVGEALFGEDEYVAQLRKCADAESVRGRVHFLGFRDDVPELMRCADVVVHCSTAPEPFGRVIVEAMLARRPVIASNAGGAAEIIEHEKTGLLTPIGDADALAGAVRRVLADAPFAHSLATAGHADACTRFRIEDRVAETNAVIDRAASRKR